MFVCNYNRKTFVVDHRQKYVEIAKDCLWIEIADERLRFLQTKHLQCGRTYLEVEIVFLMNYLKLQRVKSITICQNVKID